MDDRDGRRAAEALSLSVLGTLRVLADAAQHGFADLPAAIERLRATNFRMNSRVVEQILERAKGV